MPWRSGSTRRVRRERPRPPSTVTGACSRAITMPMACSGRSRGPGVPTSKLFFACPRQCAHDPALRAPSFCTCIRPGPIRRSCSTCCATIAHALLLGADGLRAAAPGGLPTDAFRSVRQLRVGGERLPAEIYHAWRERFGVEILTRSARPETIFMFVSNRPGRSRAAHRQRPRRASRCGCSTRRAIPL